jgi:hypothetical protein
VTAAYDVHLSFDLALAMVAVAVAGDLLLTMPESVQD